MRAIVCPEISQDISILRLEQRELPATGPGEIKVRLRAAAVNFPDILMIQGKYQFKPEIPFIPGMEGAGEIMEVGESVRDFSPGERVVVKNRCGLFAEEILVAPNLLRQLPDSVEFASGAAYSMAYLTAHVALHRRARLEPGETLLVHGAAGGVGLAAVDVGKLMGAEVIAAAGSEEKLAFLKQRGADHAILYTSGFRQEVKRITAGRGADVIFDPVGGDVFDESVRCIAWGGRLLVIGFTSGRIPTIGVNMPLIKGFSVVGVRAGEFGRRDPQKGEQNVATIDAWLAEGKIRPHICATFPLDQTLGALGLMQERAVIGKVVLTM